MKIKENKTKTSGIYALYNTNKNIYYIGSSQNIEKRIDQHLWSLKKKRHYNKKMQEDYNNGDQFEGCILYSMATDNKRELQKQEEHYIDWYRRKRKPLYNVIYSCNTGYADSDMIKKKMADLFCRKEYGMSINRFLAQSDAKRTMEYEILEHPENREKIQREFEPLIKYQNMQAFCRGRYNITYEEYLNMPEEQRKAL